MTSEELKQIKLHWIKLSVYYQTRLPDEVLSLYAEDVADLPFQRVMLAMVAYRKNPKNTRCPLPGAIRALALPEEDSESQAQALASKIIEAVARFGWVHKEDAQEYLGETAWDLVQRFGGWSHLCANLGVTINQTTFFAQVRDVARTTLKLGAADLSLPAADVLKLPTKEE